MKKRFLSALLGLTFASTSLFSNLSATTIDTSLLSSAASSTSYAVLDATDDATPFSWDNATVYFVLTDRFLDGNTSNDTSYGRVKTDAWGKNIGTFHGGDIAGLTQKLNDGYFKDLGVNAIWISAPFEQAHGFVGGGDNGDFAHYPYHGYYALDFTTMDKNMGTVEEMRTFVDTAHEQGIRVILDVVMNHVGYLTFKDMVDYNINPTNASLSTLANWTPSNGQTWHSYHDLIDYNGHYNEWAKWWGSGWIRAGVSGYTAGDGSELRQNLNGLPDVKTEVTSNQGLPPILKIKWAQETSGYDNWIIPAAKSLRTDLGISPAEYQIEWLASWVREFGIDGFRADTAKHVDTYRWGQLKDACIEALNDWRAANPDKPGADWDEDFWTTAEVFGHGVNQSTYHSTGKFDSVINFNFPKSGDISSIDSTYQSYANSINSSDAWNSLSYISSHDTDLVRGDMIDLGSTLLLSPGGVQIFYGDETNRQRGESGSDSDQGTRSDMNWSSMDTYTLAHWQTVGQFRNNHIAIGAGSHTKLNASPYTFMRSYHKNGIDDDVIVVLDANGTQTIDVSKAFANDSLVRDAYTGNEFTVKNGKVTVTPGNNGVILLELVTETLTPKISVSKGIESKTTKYYTDSLDITISLTNASNGSYQINNGEWVDFNGSTTITIGAGEELETTTTLNVVASNDEGDASFSASYLKTVLTNAKVHFYKPSDWGTPYLYYYTADEKPVSWPGVEMTAEGNNYYSCELDELENAYVIFNDQASQDPIQGQEGYLVEGEKWYKDGEWYDEQPPVPTVPTVKEGELKLFMYKPADWGSNLNAYVYNDSSSSVTTLSTWPGTAMTNEGSGLYSIELDSSWLNSKVIFNDGSNQYPASVGLDVDASRCYMDGEWLLCEVEEDNTPSVSATPGSCTFSDTITITLNADNAEVATYSINNEEAVVPYTDGEQITLGEDMEDGESVDLVLYAINGTETVSKAYTYTKDVQEETALKVYFDNDDFNWSTVNVYVYNDENDVVETVVNWPGVAMTYEGNDIYSYELPETFSSAKVIFNNGSSQIPASGQTGFVVNTENPSMIYQNHSWVAFDDDDIPTGTTIYFNNNNYNWSTVNAYVYDESTGSVLEVASWPGTPMTNEGNNIYSFTLKEDWASPKVIFNNGSNQIPASGQAGFDVADNMILNNGVWSSK